MPLVPWPPTSTRFLAACAKPEAFTGNPGGIPSVPGIPLATIDQKLSSRASRCVNIALSDRIGAAGVASITHMDDGFEDIVFALTARDLMASRGYNRDAGADSEIVRLADDAKAELLLMAPGEDGANGKRVTPQYTLAATVAPQDSVYVRSALCSDEWAMTTAQRSRSRLRLAR